MAAGRRRLSDRAAEPAGGSFRHPLHPALAHLPIGAWVCSMLFDIGSRLVSRPAALAEGSAWLIAVGVVAALAAAASGVADMRWVEQDSAAFRTATAHMALNVSLIFAYAMNLGWRYRSHALRTPAGAGPLALSAACVVALGVSGFLGGKLAYGHGVRMAARQPGEGA